MMISNPCNNYQAIVSPALILIPDISGFTEYMSTGTIEHSQVNIARLLESILNANDLDLSVSEIEGDAILFYKFNTEISINAILLQIEKMYSGFHRTLKDIQKNNECKCGACDIMSNLSIKFIVHYGKVGSLMVKDYCKLFGKDIITVHRLLKNSIPLEEYVLLTDAFIKRYYSNSQQLKNRLIKLIKQSDTYNALGTIEYYFFNFEYLNKSSANQIVL